jgi:hypothetical protein
MLRANLSQVRARSRSPAGRLAAALCVTHVTGGGEPRNGRRPTEGQDFPTTRHPGAPIMTRKRSAIAAAVAAAASAAVIAGSVSAQDPATTSLHLVSTDQAAVGFQPRNDLRQGDRVGFGDKLTGDDTGFDRGICTVVGTRHARQALCNIEVQLSKGTLSAQGLIAQAPGAKVRLAVTGGTGAYAGARGSATVQDIGHTSKSDIQITLLP